MTCETKDSKIIGECDKPKVVIVKRGGMQGETGTITPEDSAKIEKAVADSGKAVETANEAKVSADSAVKTSEGAKATANEANTKSDKAVLTANEAKSEATNAVGVAESAKEIAGGAKDSAMAEADKAKVSADNAKISEDNASAVLASAYPKSAGNFDPVGKIELKENSADGKQGVVMSASQNPNEGAEVRLWDAKSMEKATAGAFVLATAGNKQLVGGDDGTLTWNKNKVIDSPSLQGQLKDYLPLTGGTLTGNLRVRHLNLNYSSDSTVIRGENGDVGRAASIVVVDGDVAGGLGNRAGTWEINSYTKADSYQAKRLSLSDLTGDLTYGFGDARTNDQVLTTASQEISTVRQVQVCKNIGARRVHAQGDGWIQWEDGEMEIFQKVVVDTSVSKPVSSVFSSEEFSVDFPVPFTDYPSVTVAGCKNSSGATNWWVGAPYERTYTGVRGATVIRPTSVSMAVRYVLTVSAKGKWR